VPNLGDILAGTTQAQIEELTTSRSSVVAVEMEGGYRFAADVSAQVEQA
jgi:ADP-glucose pyrophosphorylase